MRMFITDYDVAIVFRSALTRTAKCIGIDNIDWKSNQELHDEIKISGSDLVNPLEDFLISYGNWYNFHIEKKEKDEFDGPEKQKLNALINSRDMSRKNLIDILDSRDC